MDGDVLFIINLLRTFGGFDPLVRKIKPFGSFVRNLNDIKLFFPAVSHGGKICKLIKTFLLIIGSI